MENTKSLLKEITSIFSLNFMIIVVIIGLILVFYDAKKFKENENNKDYKIARGIGVLYIILGPLLYIVGMIVIRN